MMGENCTVTVGDVDRRVGVLIWMIGGLVALTASLHAWEFLRISELHTSTALMQQQTVALSSDVADMAADTAKDAAQDATLRKHWKLHEWAKTQIQRLSIPEVVEWPDF